MAVLSTDLLPFRGETGCQGPVSDSSNTVRMLTVQWDRDTYLIHHCLLKPNYYRRWRWRMGTKERRRRESLGPWYQGWEQKRSHIFDSWTFSNTPHFSNFCQIPILYKLILEYSSSSSTLHTIHLKLMKYCTSIILQLKKKLTWLGIIPFQEGKKKKKPQNPL